MPGAGVGVGPGVGVGAGLGAGEGVGVGVGFDTVRGVALPPQPNHASAKASAAIAGAVRPMHCMNGPHKVE